ncbi:MAG: DUF4783 domain-containing protein [Sediminibacterium sp.]|nr:DUF4783 domain-containing protein [Sediminibacterium sp.]TXT33978.1 MAG: hypothetical protein FD136_585 [Chitinophagaceae bacterium]
MQRIFLSILLLGLSFSAIAQSETDAIVQSFKTANVEEIAKHFDDFVDLKLLEKDEVKNMSKNQAAIALKAFFAENGIKGFDKVSEGGKGTLAYLVGKLSTNGKSYNITIQMKQKAAKMQIITLRIS